MDFEGRDPLYQGAALALKVPDFQGSDPEPDSCQRAAAIGQMLAIPHSWEPWEPCAGLQTPPAPESPLLCLSAQPSGSVPVAGAVAAQVHFPAPDKHQDPDPIHPFRDPSSSSILPIHSLISVSCCLSDAMRQTMTTAPLPFFPILY